MLPGTWHDDAGAQRLKVTAGFGIFSHPASVDVEAGMFDGHPALGSDSPSASASLTVHPNRATTRLAPDPVTRRVPGVVGPSWPPAPGHPVTVDVGDGVQSFRLFTGEVDVPSGGLAPQVGVDAIDLSDRLDRQISDLAPRAEDPLLAIRPPMVRDDGTRSGILYAGLTSTTLVDRAARAAGFFACAPIVWETRLAVPMMGSLSPDVGRLEWARRGTGDEESVPDVVTTPYGLAVRDTIAHYSFEPTTAGGWVTVTMDLPNREAAGFCRAVVFDKRTTTATTAPTGFQLGYDHATDEVYCGTYHNNAPNPVTATSHRLPRAGATRVAMRVRSTGGTQTMMLRRDTDATATTFTETTPLIPSGWSARYAIILSQAAVGGVTVSNPPDATAWGPLTAPRTARIRPGYVSHWRASRDTVDTTARSVLAMIARAECAQWWLDGSGVFQWAGPGVLDTQPVTARLSTRDTLASLPWTQPRDSTAQRVRLTWLASAIIFRTVPSLTLWTGSGASGMVNGDAWEDIASPDPEVDWHEVDETITVADTSTTRADLIVGTVAASELTNAANDSGWSVFQTTWTNPERLSARAWLMSATVANVPSGHDVNLNTPDVSTLVPYWRGKNMPWLRGHGRTRWAERRDPTATATGLAVGMYEYVHDCGWIVQNATRRAWLRTYLAAEMSKGYPVYRGVEVRPDPRIQIGDRIELQDPDQTGLLLTCIVQGIRSSWRDGAASMSIDVRVLSHVKTDLTDTPDPHWLQAQPVGPRAI